MIKGHACAWRQHTAVTSHSLCSFHTVEAFLEKKKRIKNVQNLNNVRACFNKARRLFQLFGAGSLKKLSMPPIGSVAPDACK